ncbi:hypothetical protein BGW39_002994 [Mortierella sp. 14UC]|nr:hypothetical protein BGW39_002994 [Mortierella sp. 14UC]
MARMYFCQNPAGCMASTLVDANDDLVYPLLLVTVEGQTQRRLCHHCRIQHYEAHPDPLPKELVERDVTLTNIQYHVVPRVTRNEAKNQYGLNPPDLHHVPVNLELPYLWNAGVEPARMMKEADVLSRARVKHGGDVGLAHYRRQRGIKVPEGDARIKRDIIRSVFAGDNDQDDDGNKNTTFGRWFPGYDLDFVKGYIDSDMSNVEDVFTLRAEHAHP